MVVCAKKIDIWEGSFALNLIILSAVTYIVKTSGRNVGYTSVSITFIGILVFQLADVTCITQYLKRKCRGLKAAINQVHQVKAK